MNRIISLLVFSVFVSWTSAALALETKLLDITNNHYSDEKAEVDLVQNQDGSIWGLHYIQVNGSKKKERLISLEDMKSGNPTLRTESVFNVTVTRVHADANFSATSGGAFQLDLLQGLGNFRTIHFELDQQGSRWVVYSNEKNGRHDVVRAYLNTRATGINSVTLYDSAGNAHPYVLGRDF